MPSAQFYTVVISVSDILPLDKGHYISVKWVVIRLYYASHSLLTVKNCIITALVSIILGLIDIITTHMHLYTKSFSANKVYV